MLIKNNFAVRYKVFKKSSAKNASKYFCERVYCLPDKLFNHFQLTANLQQTTLKKSGKESGKC